MIRNFTIFSVLYSTLFMLETACQFANTMDRFSVDKTIHTPTSQWLGKVMYCNCLTTRVSLIGTSSTLAIYSNNMRVTVHSYSIPHYPSRLISSTLSQPYFNTAALTVVFPGMVPSIFLPDDFLGGIVPLNIA